LNDIRLRDDLSRLSGDFLIADPLVGFSIHLMQRNLIFSRCGTDQSNWDRD